MVSADERYTKKRITVLGHEMAYVEVGTGVPRQIPIEGEPADVVAIVDDYGAAIARWQDAIMSSPDQRRTP